MSARPSLHTKMTYIVYIQALSMKLRAGLGKALQICEMAGTGLASSLGGYFKVHSLLLVEGISRCSCRFFNVYFFPCFWSSSKYMEIRGQTL